MVAFKFENEIFETQPPHLKALGDIRFRQLLSTTEWYALPKAVRARFGKRVAGGESKLYKGQVTKNEMSRIGYTLAQILRLVGAPLPLETGGIGAPAIVTVTEDKAGKGQFWMRQYGRKTTFPQIIHSAKRFTGPTGLEEHIGCGIGMTLILKVVGADLLFESHKYFIETLGRRLYLPTWMTPGTLTIAHIDKGENNFEFALKLQHPFFGKLIDQTAQFTDVKEVEK